LERGSASPAQAARDGVAPLEPPIATSIAASDEHTTPEGFAPDGVQAVMAQFQQTMTHFMDTQRRVMLSYLEGTAGSALTDQAPQTVAVPSDTMTSEVSPPRTESVRVEQPATSLPQEQAMPAMTLPSSEPSAELPDKAALSAELLAIVSERTGYPPDMLKLDLDLEADLGIDSIKRVEILGNFQESLGAALRQDSEQMMEKLAGVKTLGGIVGWIEERLMASTETIPHGTEPVAPPPVAAGNDKAKLTERLLAIVSERTGYPPEMLKLDLDLEADLGIDSIKRVEILGNFQESLGAAAQEGAGEMMEGLAGVKTLGGIIEWIEDRLGAPSESSRGEATGPQESPQTPTPAQTPAPDSTAVDHDLRDDVQIKRYTLAPVESPLQKPGPGLAKDRVIVVTEDGDGGDDGRAVARTLAVELGRRGYPVALVRMGHETREDGEGRYVSALSSLEDAGELVELIRRQSGPIGGVVHLHPLTPAPSMEDLDLEAWKDRIHAETKSLFYLAKAASAELQGAAAEDGACLVAATAMGGAFATSLPSHEAEFFPGQGGVHGLLKTLALEWPEVRVKAVDVNPLEATETLADHLCEEILFGDELVAVGYETSGRVTLKPVGAPLPQDDSEGVAIDSSSVILVTGGARGVTADAACYLAQKYQPTLVLIGRSPLPAAESAETAELTESQELKAALIQNLRQTDQTVSPARVEAAYRRLLKDRDMRAKLAAMKQAGATVDYRQVDVRDAKAFAQVIEEVYGAYGRLNGVIHGAGVIEDKLIEDKTPESFDRVFDTKVDSAFLLSRELRSDGLKFLVLFSSVAGCFGNRGQADYAAANEVLNKLALYLDHRWPARVVAINWGPWATAGMVSAALERQFAERGVALIPRPTGQRLLDEELRLGRKGEAEVVIGGAGWQASEAKATVRSSAGLPLIRQATFSRFGANGAEKLVVTLDTARHTYLRDHQIDDQPVLPMAVAMELMVETVAERFPELQVVGVQDLKVLQGVVLENGAETLQVRRNECTSRPRSNWISDSQAHPLLSRFPIRKRGPFRSRRTSSTATGCFMDDCSTVLRASSR
jgi:NAD(P)-dependent dehydrogenase (short-subunit alcohol dehydrogenase family)/acyl carrier protein